MAASRKPPHTPKELRARAVQLENDTVALHLVRRAAGYELRATKLAAAGNVTAPGTFARAATFRAVAARLVLDKRPASLGVPGWARARCPAMNDVFAVTLFMPGRKPEVMNSLEPGRWVPLRDYTGPHVDLMKATAGLEPDSPLGSEEE